MTRTEQTELPMVIHGEPRPIPAAINLAPTKDLVTSEFRVVALRECATREDLSMCDKPEKVAEYYRTVVSTSPSFQTDVETFVVLFLNVRKRVKGFAIVATGTQDTLLVSPSVAFRAAVCANAAAVILLHNHPSGDPSPSEADIKVTRDLIRGGQVLKVEVLDHVIMGLPRESGGPDFVSLREMGYIYTA